MTRTQLLRGHNKELVRDGERFIVGCTCGWTCTGSCDDEIFAIEVFHLHMRVVYDLLNKITHDHALSEHHLGDCENGCKTYACACGYTTILHYHFYPCGRE